MNRGIFFGGKMSFATIDTWFNGTSELTYKTKGYGGKRKPVGVRYGGKRHKNANNNIKKSMQAMTIGGKKIPQIMVKITGGGKGIDKTQAHVNYIGRNGELTVYDQDGLEYKGVTQRELLKTWEAMGANPKAKNGTVHESHNIVFSMPKGTSEKDLLKAVQALAEQEFKGHKYFLAQHLDTDSPHCHLIVSATDDRGARLLITKKDLHNYRVAMVNQLAEQNIEAVTSHRIHHYETKFSKEQKYYHTTLKEPKQSQNSKKLDDIFKKVTKTYIEALNDKETPQELKPYIEAMLKSRGVVLADKAKQEILKVADELTEPQASLLLVERIANAKRAKRTRDTSVQALNVPQKAQDKSQKEQPSSQSSKENQKEKQNDRTDRTR